MYLVIRADGKLWDGLGWNVKGKIFCTIGGATRSLHEEGEPTSLPIEFVDYDNLSKTKENVSTPQLPTRNP